MSAIIFFERILSKVLLIIGIILLFSKYGFIYGLLANIVWFVFWFILVVSVKTIIKINNMKYQEKEHNRKYNIK